MSAEVSSLAVEERLVQGEAVQRVEAWIVPAADLRAMLPAEERKGFLLSSIPLANALEYPETLAAWRDLVVQMASDGNQAVGAGALVGMQYTALKITTKAGT